MGQRLFSGCNFAVHLGWGSSFFFSLVLFLSPKVLQKGYNWRFMDVGGLHFLFLPCKRERMTFTW